MTDSSQIKEHMEVVGSDGNHVGTVDKVEGNAIKLTRNDPAADGVHHQISFDMVASVEQNRVLLRMSGQEARENWETKTEVQSENNSMSACS